MMEWNQAQNQFVINSLTGVKCVFNYQDGLYVCDFRSDVPAYPSEAVAVERKHLFTQRELKEIEEAVKFRRAMGNKPTSELIKLMSSMSNCPVSVRAVLNADKLHGKDLALLRGSSTK
jgi:hypothetical protein